MTDDGTHSQHIGHRDPRMPRMLSYARTGVMPDGPYLSGPATMGVLSAEVDECHRQLRWAFDGLFAVADAPCATHPDGETKPDGTRRRCLDHPFTSDDWCASCHAAHALIRMGVVRG